MRQSQRATADGLLGRRAASACRARLRVGPGRAPTCRCPPSAWDFNHFVVLDVGLAARRRGRRPSAAPIAAEFDASFTGVLLAFGRPGLSAANARRRPAWLAISRIWRVPAFKPLVAQMVGASAVLLTLGGCRWSWRQWSTTCWRAGRRLSILGLGLVLLVVNQLITSYLH
jgi:hypothetical protein